MSREDTLQAIKDCLNTAPKTTPKVILAALEDAVTQLESAPRGTFRDVALECANELDEAAQLKIGVMDSDSKIALVNCRRLAAMESVSARLREYA